MTSVKDIQDILFEMQDVKYKEFIRKLIPTVDPNSVIGVRTPELRKLAKKLMKEGTYADFLNHLPHSYFDENQLHAFLITEIKDYDRCVEEIGKFLPYVDNWATCDQMSPRVFKKYKEEILDEIREWIRSEDTYTVRFAIGMLMKHFLDDDFDLTYPEMVASVKSEEYYINMMTAWYFATGLAKQYEAILPYFEKHKLDTWTHNKSIQKAVESYRITAEQKEYLKSLKVKRCDER